MNRRRLLTGAAAISAFAGYSKGALAQATPITAPAQPLNGVTINQALIQGELVKVAFRSDQTTLYAAGTSTAQYIIQGQLSNTDEANQSITLTVPPGTTQGASIQFVTYGTVIGVRFLRNTTTPPFSVMIDGIAYAVPNTAYKWAGLTAAAVDGDAFTIVAKGLPDGAHSVEIAVASDPTGGATYALVVYGFIAERRVGYKERDGYMNVLLQGTVPGTSTAFTTTSSPSFRKIRYTNTGAAAAQVVVVYGAATVDTINLAAASTDGCTRDYDPGDYSALSQYKHSASPTTVNYTVYGRK